MINELFNPNSRKMQNADKVSVVYEIDGKIVCVQTVKDRVGQTGVTFFDTTSLREEIFLEEALKDLVN